MRTILIAGLLPLGLLLNTSELRAGYGDTRVVEHKMGHIISPGWVITGKRFAGSPIFSPNFPTRTFHTMVNLNGAPVGEVIEILGESPIPPGWEIIQTRGNTGADKTEYKIRHRIQKVTEAGVFGGDADLPPVTQGTLDFDVKSMDPKNTKRHDGTPYFPPKDQEDQGSSDQAGPSKGGSGAWAPVALD